MNKPIKINESRLKFSFDSNYWQQVIQFDTHADYINMSKHLGGTKAIDFLGVSDDRVLLMEVKNYTGYTHNHKEKFENPSLIANIIAQKVRDSLPCIVGSQRTSRTSKIFWKDILNKIQNPETKINVVFWFEHDYRATNSPQKQTVKNKRQKIGKGSLRTKLKQKLRWLTPNVEIFSTKNYKSNSYLSDTLKVSDK